MKADAKKKATSKPSDSERLLDAYRQMLRARKADEKAIILYKQNKCHFQIGCAGHEAVQVAAGHALRPCYDWAYPYYRDMAFVVSWGMTAKELMLNALNKPQDPNSGGRQMPMHYGHKALNIVSQSSPTGTQFLQAVGTAKAIKHLGEDAVVYVSAGEGTTAQGSYHEMLNWAAREKLPLIVLIQDNKYAISVHISEQIAGQSVAKTSSGYEGLSVVEVDGLDYRASYKALSAAVSRARAGKGPTVIAAEVVRLQSHSISDNQAKYRSKEEIEADKAKDPIAKLRKLLLSEKLATDKQLQAIEAEIQADVDQAAEWADSQPDAPDESFNTHVLINPDPAEDVDEPQYTGEELFIVDALNQALDEEMSRDPNMLIFGQDVAYGKGGVFTVTTGLSDKHGRNRCFNSPLAEESIVGTAIGMSVRGLKPVVEIQFGDYIWTAMMQIRNELSMMLYRSAGAFSCPVVIRVAVGGYIHGAPYHSQNIEATFAHFPGMHILYPSNAADAKGLLKSAVRSKDPVLFLEHKGLYRQVYAKAQVGDKNACTPIGRARVVREGADATVVTWGALVQKSLVAANALEKEGYQIEVIDLRTIAPLDTDTILRSVEKTNRVLVAHEDMLFGGFGGEISALLSEHAFRHLDAPILRLGAAHTPVPHATNLEDMVLPQTESVTSKLRELLAF